MSQQKRAKFLDCSSIDYSNEIPNHNKTNILATCVHNFTKTFKAVLTHTGEKLSSQLTLRKFLRSFFFVRYCSGFFMKSFKVKFMICLLKFLHLKNFQFFAVKMLVIEEAYEFFSSLITRRIFGWKATY
jgi:hypothetical protein